MTFKVVRDANANVICFGPNDDHYNPTLSTGQSLHIEDNEPAEYIAELQNKAKNQAAARQAIFDKLGLTANEAAALFG